MFRRLSSLVLISFLTLLVGVKDLALGFCLCEESLFLGKDPCSESTGEVLCCSDCAAPQEEPCDDCVVPLQLEVEDYLWAADDSLPKVPAPPSVVVLASADMALLTPLERNFPPAFEPPPPLGRELLIRQQRLRL